MTARLVRGALQRQVPVRPHKPSSWRLGARSLRPSDECDMSGCHRSNLPCFLPDDLDRPSEYLCAEHAHQAGYCIGCGQFSAGIESFDFRVRYQGYCDNCAHQMEGEDERELRDLRGDDWDYFDEDNLP